MTLSDLASRVSDSAIGWLVAGFLAGVVWLVRRIFTNQTQIELMRVSLKSMCRDRDRDLKDHMRAIAKIEDAQKDMARDIKQLTER